MGCIPPAWISSLRTTGLGDRVPPSALLTRGRSLSEEHLSPVGGLGNMMAPLPQREEHPQRENQIRGVVSTGGRTSVWSSGSY